SGLPQRRDELLRRMRGSRGRRLGSADGEFRCARWRRRHEGRHSAGFFLRHNQLGITGGTLNLLAAPEFVANNVLVAGGTRKFNFSHNVRVLTVPASGGSTAGISVS